MVGDLHYTRVPPASRASGYAGEIERSLEQVAEKSARFGVDAAVFAGDLFHLKGRTTHEEVAAVAPLLSAFPRRFAVPGNHDMQGNNLENARLEQPYGVLARSGVFEDLSVGPVALTDFEVVVVGLPFATEINVRTGDLVARVRALCRSKPSAVVVVSHLEISADGSVGFDGPEFVRELVAVFGCPVAVLNGHLHVDPVVVPVVGPKNVCGCFVSLGSLARTSTTDSDKAAFALVEYDYARPKSSSLSVRLVPLANLPRQAAFVERDAVVSAPAASLDDFVAALNAEAGGRGLDPVVFVRSIAVARKSPPEVLARAERLVSESR